MSHGQPEPPHPPHKMHTRVKFFPLTDASVRNATMNVPVAHPTKPLDNEMQTTDTPAPMRQVVTPPASPSVPPPSQGSSEKPTLVHRAAIPSPPLQGSSEKPTLVQRAVISPPRLQQLSLDEQLQRRSRTWVPGTSGFEEPRDLQPVKTDTFQMMVLRGIAERQGQEQGEMQSEISGAASGAAIVGFGNIAGTLLKYVGNFIIQRGFGVAIFGLYSLGLSFAMLIASLFNMGLDNAMLRYIPIYRGKQNPGALRGLVIFCTALVGAAGIAGAVLMIVFTPVLVALRHVAKDTPMLTTIFILMAPMIPLLCMQTVWFGGLQGFKAFKLRVLSQRLVPAVALIVLLLVVLVFSRHIKGVLIATLLSTLLGTVLSLFYLFRLVARQSKQHSGDYEMREWLGFATPNFLTSVTDTVLESTDTLLLAFFSVSSFGIGQYAAAIKYSNFIPLPLISLNTMFAPTIAELHSKGEFQKLEAMFKVVTRWTIILSLPIFIVTTVFSASLLAISGAGFIGAWPLLIAFSLGGIINAGTGCVGYMLLMTGHQKLSFVNSVAGIVVNVILGVILTPRYGAMGTAVSTGLAVVVLNLARLLQVRLLLKIQPYSWAVLKPLVAGLVCAAVSGALFYVLYSLHIPLLACLGLVPVSLAIYFGLIVLFRVGPEDQIVLDKLRGKLLRGKKQ
jgi:O-antigen/teichoic acid export membrane protein